MCIGSWWYSLVRQRGKSYELVDASCSDDSDTQSDGVASQAHENPFIALQLLRGIHWDDPGSSSDLEIDQSASQGEINSPVSAQDCTCDNFDKMPPQIDRQTPQQLTANGTDLNETSPSFRTPIPPTKRTLFGRGAPHPAEMTRQLRSKLNTSTSGFSDRMKEKLLKSKEKLQETLNSK